MSHLKKCLQVIRSISQSNTIKHLAIIFFIFFAVTIINFPFKSWFTGWDNLHPEFDFCLNFKRGITAVWQTNQGLGTFGGHGYAATLPHTLILFLMSLIIPVKYLRASFTFLTLILGTLGVFFLLKKILKENHQDLVNKSALIGSLFYLLNFATVENFYIQLEAFIVHYAVLPWLFWSIINYFEKKNKKSFLIFIFISLISTIQGFIPPLFFVYIILLSLFLLFYILNKFTLNKLKDAIFILSTTLLINAYWLLPVLYYSFTHSSTYLNAYNNLNSTEDFILKNKKYGKLNHVIFLRGFIVESLDTNASGETFSIFERWQNHFNNTLVLSIGYIIFGIIVIGLFSTLKKKNKYYFNAIFVGFILIFALLTTDTPPFSLVSDTFQKIPILRQAFRVAFTKFSISLSFFYAITLGIGIFSILSLLKNNKCQKIFTFLSIIGLLIFSLPTFQGNFLYKNTKINIPEVYLELFNFFKQQNKSARIANFPIGWHWGWSVYKWGYSGSGFLWYGIEQPIMDRAFDVWEKYNENYYWEISYAIYSKKFPLIDKLMDKYQIEWIIFDKNIVPYPSVKSFIYSDSLQNYLNSSNKYELIKVIRSPDNKVFDVYIYKVNLLNQSREFKSLKPIAEIKNVAPIYDFTNYDQSYEEFKDYYTNINSSPDIYYPYRTLFTNRKPLLKAPFFQNLELVYDNKKDPFFKNHGPSSCGTYFYNPSQVKQTITSNDVLRFFSLNTENCYLIILSQLTQKEAYLVEIESKNTKGKPLQFAVINLQSKKADIELTLNKEKYFKKEFIIIPPMQYDGLGYSFLFNNISVGDIESINDLKSIKIYKFPYDKLIKEKLFFKTNKTGGDYLLIFYQSYDPDWKAYFVKDDLLSKLFPFLFGKEIKEHVIVNNWANGWIISPNIKRLTSNTNNQNNQMFEVRSLKFVVIFWPQYLEFVGFGLLVVGFLSILFYKK